MLKLDLFGELKQLYTASAKEPALVDVPKLSFLMVDGEGNPETGPAFQEAIEALYPMAYTLKFALKRGPAALDYRVMPLEALWWMDDLERFTMDTKDEWRWTAMILQPDEVTQEQFAAALRQVAEKHDSPVLSKVRLGRYCEGLSAQIMHVGPYAAEAPTIEKLHAFITAQGYLPKGRHHEIYLGDPRRAAPEKLRTIIRQPVVGQTR